MIFQVAAEQPFIQPEIVFSVGNIPVTNAMIMSAFVMLIFLFVSVGILRKAKIVPGTFQTIIEILFTAILNFLETLTGSKVLAKNIFPLVGTLFIYIGISNIIGLIPGISAITYNDVALFRTPTNDFNTTFSIALAMIVLTHVASMKEFGLFGHLGKFFKFKEVIIGFKEGVGAGFLAIIDFLIGLLDIISELAKVISLSLRLFGNMYAGEVLAAILLGAFAMIVPAPWFAMNLLTGLLQALVFGSLTAAYYALAVDRGEETNA
ncbi:F0F1 ATP synthase subunit A [Patescibacteria group bacterium]|nr:F0F1 ATP synthase subunit A [Patescibacteria group bacterium]MBU1722008.1 F0F1 ATP synthase subunit A [Patescibacteria group bacterium]MBU1901242.1 F0F1 ATP synthase subunit A [Patescibacteria group bacterium]